MKISLLFCPLLAVSLSAIACGKSDSGAAGSGSGSGSGAGGGGGSTVTLPKVNNLKMEVPAGTTVADGIGSGNMVMGDNLVVSVEVASDSRSKTIEDDKKDVEMYTPKNLKTEKLADGWLLTFDNTGGMGANYFVHVRRDIGGKAIWCETTSTSTAQQENAIKACKSLKP